MSISFHSVFDSQINLPFIISIIIYQCIQQVYQIQMYLFEKCLRQNAFFLHFCNVKPYWKIFFKMTLKTSFSFFVIFPIIWRKILKTLLIMAKIPKIYFLILSYKIITFCKECSSIFLMLICNNSNTSYDKKYSNLNLRIKVRVSQV